MAFSGRKITSILFLLSAIIMSLILSTMPSVIQIVTIPSSQLDTPM